MSSKPSTPLPKKPTTTTTSSPSKPHPATPLLHRAHSPQTTQTLLSEKILKRPLYLKPTDAADSPANARTARRLARQREIVTRRKKAPKPKPLSSREKRKLGVHDVDVTRGLKTKGKGGKVDYEVFVPLHRMWVAYMHEILGLVPMDLNLNGIGGGGSTEQSEDAQKRRQREQEDAIKNWRGISPAHMATLCSADYHGAEIEVVRSRCVGRVGTKGIVVRDTKFTFIVVVPPRGMGNAGKGKQEDVEGKRGGQVKTLPKEHTIFRVTIPFPSLNAEQEKSEADGETQDEKGDEAVAKSGQSPRPKDEPRQIVFEIHGDQFKHRAVDRANKKFKPHFLPTL